MTWPTSDVSNTNVSSGTTTGAPAAARLDFKDLIDKFNQLRNHVTTFGQTLIGRSSAALVRDDLSVAPRAVRIDVASVAGTVDLTTNAPDTDDIRITGELTITGFTITAGRVVRVTAGGAFTLANNTNIVTQTGANIIFAVGDTFILRATANNTVEVMGYSNNDWRIGTLVDYAGTTAPTGALVCPTALTNISRATYAKLFAKIGTTWGVGDGSTTFGMPWFPADYAAVRANGNVGTQTVGQVISHTHPLNLPGFSGGTTPNLDTNGGSGANYTSGATGGSANLPAGVRVLKCIWYM